MNIFYHKFSNKQSGAGLIEIMIALVIGLILLEGLGYFVVSNQKLNKSHDDVSRMQESARIAMDMIGRAIRQSGYRLDTTQSFGGTALFGIDGGGTGVTALPDSIIIRHDPKWMVDATNTLAGAESDCLGTTITANNNADATTGMRAVNTNFVVYGFYIKNNQLYCDTPRVDNTAPAGGTPIVDLIENMQITYGVKDVNNNISGYVSTPPNDSSVVAVRVSLLIKGPTNTLQNVGQTYMYNGATATVNDGFLRQVYTSTFMLRNQP